MYCFFRSLTVISIPLQEVKRPTRFLSAASLYNLPAPLHYDTESLLTDTQQLNILQRKLQQLEDRDNKLIAKLQGEGAASRESLSFVKETKRKTYLLRRLNYQGMAYAPKATKSLDGERVQLVALTKAKEALEETLVQRQKLLHQTRKERAHVQSLIRFKKGINKALIEEERKATLLAKQCEEELPSLQRQLKKVEGVNEFLRREVMGYEVSTAFQNRLFHFTCSTFSDVELSRPLVSTSYVIY